MAQTAPARPAPITCWPWRTLCRGGVLVAAVALAWPGRVESPGSVVLPGLSPFLAFGSMLATRTISMVALLALPVLLLALWFPRWFCRYGCPTGFLQEILQRCRPTKPRAWQRVPEIGKWLVAITLGGACLGYPLFLLLDPLALFNGFLNAWRQPLSDASVVAGVGLLALLFLDFALPRLWCQRLCPLGASQELLAWPRRRLGSRKCDDSPETPVQREPWLGRRLFLGGCAGALGVLLVNKARASKPPPLRPPGALPEAQFTGVCIRCGNCAQTCPSRVIQPDLGASGLAGWLTPLLRFDDGYCREDCYRCGQVCPSGAIARLTLADKRRRIIGPAQVDLDTCLLANGRECTACLKGCPYQAILMHSPDGGFSNEPRVDLARCNGCGACEAVCPVRPRRAIRVVASLGLTAAGATTTGSPTRSAGTAGAPKR
jgi:ferredoxin-type protein NapF